MSVVVLIVEDEGPVLLLAEWMLQSAGYETVSTSNVADAVAILTDGNQQLGLLFTDLTGSASSLHHRPPNDRWHNHADYVLGCWPGHVGEGVRNVV